MFKTTVVFMMLVLVSQVNAQTLESSQYQAGVHYDLITPAWKTEDNEPVVYEFFSYMCPGCFAFEPIMKDLESQLDSTAKVIRVPVSFYPQWEPHAKTYHALQMMDQWSAVHNSLFAAIHQQKLPLRSIEDIGAWLAKNHDMDAQAFIKMANSFAVNNQLRKDQQMMQAMQVGTVPTLVVNGQASPKLKSLGTAQAITDATLYLFQEK